jgi:hypothetical protein
MDCVFRLSACKPGEPRITIAGLDPPANSAEDAQHDNMTSQLVCSKLGGDHFDWIDISKRSGNYVLGFDRHRYYKKLLADNNDAITRFQQDISARVEEHVNVGNSYPIVYAAGEVVNEAWERFTCVKRVRVLSQADGIEEWVTPPGCKFLLLRHHVHPSAALRAGGERGLRARVDRAMNILAAMHAVGSVGDDYIQCVHAAMQNRHAIEEQTRAEFFNCFPESNMWSTSTIPFNRPTCVQRIKLLQDTLAMTNSQFLTFISGSVGARCADDRFYEFVTNFLCGQLKMTTKDLVTFMSNSVAARFGTPGFMDFITNVLCGQLKMTTKDLVTFMCDGVAARCENPGFMDFITNVLCGQLKMTTKDLVTFMCDGVAARCENPGFMDFITNVLCGQLKMTTKDLVTFMSNSVAARFGTPGFMDFITNVLCGQLKMTTKDLVTFMCDGVAARCENPGFMDFITNVLCGQLKMTTKDLVTFMSGGVAARCENPGFMDFITNVLCGQLKMTTKDLVTFMCDGVAARCATPGFMDFITNVLCGQLKMTTKDLVTFMCDGVAARCENPGFMDFITNVLCGQLKMTTKDLVTFMSNSVAARIRNPGFMDFITNVLCGQLKMTTKDLVTFMCDGVAARCENPGFMDFITNVLCGQLKMTTKDLVTFMSGGVAARCENPGFVTMIKKIHAATDMNTICLMYRRNSFASRSAYIGDDVLAIIIHIRNHVPSLQNNPCEIARMFGESPVYKVVPQLKARLLAIDDAEMLEATFLCIRSHNQYAGQKLIAECVSTGRPFPPKKEKKRKR